MATASTIFNPVRFVYEEDAMIMWRGILYAVVILVMPLPMSAHELLPREAVIFLQTHPSATQAELSTFLMTVSSTMVATSVQSVLADRTINETWLMHIVRFIWFGIGHILSGPDHILFVLSLLLVFVSWREILQLTGSFTIAHSITLILAGTGVLTLSSRIVEPLIAFSIAYVALTTVFFTKLTDRFMKGKAKLVAILFFGLFHGLGFAGLLREIRIPAGQFLSSLVAFNVGIELGQLLIIGMAVPLLLFCRRYHWYTQMIRVTAGVIAGLGIIWGIQRLIV